MSGAPLHSANRTDGPILEARQISKTYRTEAGPLPVLTDISFVIPAGSSCAIVGPSGSGKTTLLGICAGLDLPTSGSILLGSQPLETLGEDARAQARNESVGFVFQNFQLLPTLTALENVMVPLELRGQKHIRGIALELLEKVGLGARAGHYPLQLSGGEQQRVAIARAFINQPRILFADEPTGNLDNENSLKIVDALFALNAAAGTALVLVTHNLELARRAGRIIHLKAGRIFREEIV